jgi:prolyl-tRNA synthetase
MRWSQTLIPTQKETPADAQIVSHQLLLRGGFIRQLSAGVFDFLPLGLRSLHKAARIVREEMDATGAAEILLPALQPLELWQQTGRDASYGENLFKLKDRHGRTSVLGPTHEEVITELIRAYVDSYKQLPLTLYQIQTKFRDEYRPRFGLLRVREFLMKDAYSFHASIESLSQTYDQMYRAYERIFRRCGVPVVAVEAESGQIGGSASHEFMTPADSGEDVIVMSDNGNYAANLEKAQIGTRTSTFAGDPHGELRPLHTPGLPGITDVAAHLKIEARDMLKTLVFTVMDAPARDRPENLAHPKYVVAVVRGDHDVNEAKLARAAREHFHVAQLALIDTPQVRATWAIGFVGPDEACRNPQTVVLVDPDAAQHRPWVTGGNAIDYHVANFNWFRECGDALADPRKVVVADIRNAVDGDPSPRNDGGKLQLSRGIEIGHVFKLGTKYSEALGATFKDETGTNRPIIMGCYGIGIGRILLAAIESSHDDRGIIWPKSIAPFSVVLTPVKYEGEVKRVADQLHEELNAAGIDTLLDDRDARVGFKFADADLIGIPFRITIGERHLADGRVELKLRTSAAADVVRLGNITARLRERLAGS